MSSEHTSNSPTQVRLAGLGLIALLAALVLLTVAMYNKSFTPKAYVTVQADRAGLQMNKGTIVKLRGVDVGRIASTKARGDGTVEIKLALNPHMLDKIPANVNVSLEQLTAFGNKAVIMRLPEKPGPHLVAGDVIEASHVSVEVNNVLDNLEELLTAVDPAKVNSALSAVALALDGRGEEIGETLETSNRYLKKINSDLPTLKRNIEKGSKVLELYGDVAPDLIRTLSNSTVLAKTVTDNAEAIRTVLVSADAVGRSGGRFMALNGDRLAAFLSRLTTTTGLLEKYSPEIACFLRGADQYQTIARPAYGGVFASANVVAGLEIGTGAYKNPQNLPNMAADSGPNCHGMPNYKGGPLPKSILQWDDRGGPNPYPTKPELNDTPLLVQLFGPLASNGNVR
jgi:phospholipid/cholesterol/gamma-HCH transport system substrate-binding protein